MLLAFIVGFLFGKERAQNNLLRDEKFLNETVKTAKEIDKRIPHRTVAEMLQTAKERQR